MKVASRVCAIVAIVMAPLCADGEIDPLETELRVWEAEMMRPVDWRPLSPSIVGANPHARVTVNADGSVFLSGRAAYFGTLAITAQTDLREITALRVELLPSPNARGDAVITNLRVVEATPSGAKNPVGLQNATSDIEGSVKDPGRIIDASPETGWKFRIPQNAPLSIVVETTRPVGAGSRTELVFTISQNRGRGTLSRFRLFATSKPRPVRVLPASIRSILQIEPTERSEAQRNQIADYFRASAHSAKEF